MEWLRLSLALLLPTALGVCLVRAAGGPATRDHSLLLAGYGTLLGLLGLPQLMRLMNLAGLPLTFGGTALAVALTGAAALLAGGAARARWPIVTPAPVSQSALTAAQRVLLWACGALLAVRLAGLGLELLWRPLFPWDATMHWATKARVWFELGAMAPFVENAQWLQTGGAGVYTDHHPAYPPTVPLLQVWISLALRRWDESLVNLPWLVCVMALGAAFFAQARRAGVAVGTAMAFTYLLLSLPLLDTHVALAGYADLILGCCYCAAVMALYNWCVDRQACQALLAAAFALLCTQIKNEGLYWALSLVPALLVMKLSPRQLLALGLALAALLATVLAALPRDLVLAGHSLAGLRLTFHPEAWPALMRQLFIFDNWHLLAYLLLLLIPLALLRGVLRDRSLRALLAGLGSAVALYLVLFLGTKFSYGAIHYTASGRIALHLMPSLAYLAMLLFDALYRLDQSASSSSGDSG
ncbi:MAG: hypothetical protein KDI01_08575 [Halioglobus sp.]|nr:hypothetical protein [Halioglobus sp.]